MQRPEVFLGKLRMLESDARRGTIISMSTDELRSAALSLPTEDRANLAKDLLQSLHGPADPNVDAAWLAEVERRAHEIADGTVEPVDWEVARERIARRLRERRR